jgi:hypothetical protein
LASGISKKLWKYNIQSQFSIEIDFPDDDDTPSQCERRPNAGMKKAAEAAFLFRS